MRLIGIKHLKMLDMAICSLLNMLADQVAALSSWLERTIYGYRSELGFTKSQGGQGVTWHAGLPRFFKVGVQHMPHDARLMSALMWGDMYEGKKEFASFPEKKLEKLQGKLLMMEGCSTQLPPAVYFDGRGFPKGQ